MFIGISQRLICNESYSELREALSVEWGAFFNVEFGDFLPLPLCVEIPFSRYERAIKGVILSGGNDLSVFNKTRENKIRDNYEARILTRCVNLQMPILAICRGAQFMAHFFGSEILPCENHIGAHLVRDNQGREFLVNSFHNYAITKLGDCLQSLAVAKDSSIEAFRHKNLPFYALMWHCERENGLNNTAILENFKSAIFTYSQIKCNKNIAEVSLGDFVGFQARNCENRTDSSIEQLNAPNPAKASKRQTQGVKK